MIFIKSLEIKNFKSFKHVKLDLNDMNVLIGANASGKSNFISLFEFLRDITEHGLENAIELQGGLKYLRNLNVDPSEESLLKLELKLPEMEPRKNLILYDDLKEWKFVYFKLNSIIYELKIYPSEEDELKRIEEKVTLKVNELKMNLPGEISIHKSNGKLDIKLSHNLKEHIKKERLLVYPIDNIRLPEKSSLIEAIFPVIDTDAEVDFLSLSALFKKIGIYDFQPDVLKRPQQLKGKATLEKDASNLNIVLRNILKDPENRRAFFNILQYLLPFVKDIKLEPLGENYLRLKLREEFSSYHEIPSAFLSDGTLTIIALITALYFSNDRLIIIEEPTRNVHPSLISSLMEIIKDVGKEKQVILTTHNPELVRYASKYLLLVSRDEEGFSKITNPLDKEDVRIFLENEIGIDELYIQNLLGG